MKGFWKMLAKDIKGSVSNPLSIASLIPSMVLGCARYTSSQFKSVDILREDRLRLVADLIIKVCITSASCIADAGNRKIALMYLQGDPDLEELGLISWLTHEIKSNADVIGICEDYCSTMIQAGLMTFSDKEKAILAVKG